jgi:pyrroloquinoline quinone (PQQ) biosynthesis protein C
MIEALADPWQRAAWPRLFAETAAGHPLPPLAVWRRVLRDFFVVVEGFPKYMALSLAKTTYGKRDGDARVRRWLLQNLAVEARHAEWYLDWLEAVGITPAEVVAHVPCDEVRALHDHLWQCCANGSLAEGIAAANWAIEGVTGIWSRGVAETFRFYADDGVRIDSRSMMWLNAHARYDDAHPDEALEALKLFVDDHGRRGNPAAVQAVARRSLELFAAAVERCYDLATD